MHLILEMSCRQPVGDQDDLFIGGIACVETAASQAYRMLDIGKVLMDAMFRDPIVAHITTQSDERIVNGNRLGHQVDDFASLP